MSQLKNDIESSTAQVRILATDEEGVWPSTARVTVLGDMSYLKVYDAVPRFTDLNPDQHPLGQILEHDLQARA